MKLSLFKNDKSTVTDELILSFIILCFLVSGALLIYFRPSFWLITESISVCVGVMFVMFFVMMLPGLIYRFCTNDKKVDGRCQS